MKRIIVVLALAAVGLHGAVPEDPTPAQSAGEKSDLPVNAASSLTNEVSKADAPTATETEALPELDGTGEPDAGPGEGTAEEAERTKSKLGLETHIYSDSAEFGLRSRLVTYTGNVRVEDPRMNLTCEQLMAKVPSEGTRLEQIVAKTNVVITASDKEGRQYTAKGDLAVYTYQINEGTTNEVVELSGSPSISGPDGTLSGEVIVWDRISNTMKAVNQRTVFILPEETEKKFREEVDPEETAPTNDLPVNGAGTKPGNSEEPK